MTATIETTDQPTVDTARELPPRNMVPKTLRSMSDREVIEWAERWADEHGVHAVVESYTNRARSFVPFRTADQAAEYVKGLATTDQRPVPRRDRLPRFVAVVHPEPRPVKGHVGHLYDHQGVASVTSVLSVNRTGVSVEVEGKRVPFKRTGRNRYTRGSSVFVLAAID